MVIGHGHQLQHAVSLRQEAEALVPEQRIPHGGLPGDHQRRLRRRADRGEHRPGPVGDEQQIRLQLILITAGDILDRRWVVRVDGRLDLRRVRDEARHLRERLRARRPQLIDQSRRRDHFPLKRLFGFPGDAHVDEVDRDADREHGEEGAREEDAAAERGEHRDSHVHRTVKSSSATPPGGIVDRLGFGCQSLRSTQSRCRCRAGHC